MNKKISTIFAILIVAVLTVTLCVASVPEQTSTKISDTAITDLSATTPRFTNRPVIILGSSDFSSAYSEYLGASTANIEMSNELNATQLKAENSMLFIDGHWLAKSNLDLNSKLLEVIQNKVPVIILQGSSKTLTDANTRTENIIYLL